MKLFVVTHGEYSDYHIKGIFSSEESAKESIKLYGDPIYDDSCQIEEYTLDEVPRHPPGLYPFSVAFDLEGILDRVYQIDCDLVQEGYLKVVESLHCGRPYCLINFHVWASDKEHALKIAVDKRRELIAMRHLVNDKLTIVSETFK